MAYLLLVILALCGASIAATQDARKVLEDNLVAARTAYERNPGDADALIWLGRRTAYLGRYEEAIGIFTKGILEHPADARMYRHRGHRYITTRQFDRAIADLTRAAELVSGKSDEVEPDGQPNARRIPTSTLQTNVWYHLGLAHYVTGRFDAALPAYRECLKASANPDMLVATSHWLYMTLRRLGRDDEAREVLKPIEPGMDIIENGSYHRLLLMYKGTVTPESLRTGAAAGLDATTVGYGVGNWDFYNGRRDEAQRIWRAIVAGDQKSAFGYIAAEADLERMRKAGF